MVESGCISVQRLQEIAVAAQQKIKIQQVIEQLNEEGGGKSLFVMLYEQPKRPAACFRH